MIEPHELALLTTSFTAAMQAAPGPGEADAELHALGWPDLLAVAPALGAAAAFGALGSTGSAATLLDDVLLVALGRPADRRTCVVLPPPQRAAPAGRHRPGGAIRVDGVVSCRVESASSAVVPVVAGGGTVVVEVDARVLRAAGRSALDPHGPYRRVSGVELVPGDTVDLGDGSWDGAVGAARAALAHQLLGASRQMLGLARSHAVDRVQFGRAIGSFQAVRHRLAESLVAIEGAQSVADVAAGMADPLVAALAKSLAGKAARSTATNAQQVLAGIGFTAEHRFHHVMKRTMVLDTLFGSAKSLPVEIGREVLARRGAPRLVEL